MTWCRGEENTMITNYRQYLEIQASRKLSGIRTLVQKTPEWAITAIITTGLTVICTILWDNYKFDRDNRQKEDAALFALKNELMNNLVLSELNRGYVMKEMSKAIPGGNIFVLPVDLLNVGAFEWVKANIPRSLTVNKKLLRDVMIYYIRVDGINEVTRSRELYRHIRERGEKFFSGIEIYNKELTKKYDELIKLLYELNKAPALHNPDIPAYPQN
jgi:hypothetical protein